MWITFHFQHTADLLQHVWAKMVEKLEIYWEHGEAVEIETVLE